MECGKQGLASFNTNVYKVDNGYRNDYSDIPRPRNNLCILLNGTAEITEGNNTIKVFSDEVFFIPKGAKYISVWSGNGKIVFQTLHFEFDRQFDPLKNFKIAVQKIDTEDTETIKCLFSKLLELQNTNSFEFNTCFYSVCEKTLDKLKYTKNTQVSIVQPALDYLDKNYSKKITVKELADICCVSEPHFYALFKRDTGSSPIEYKNKLCIHRAMEELLTDRSKSIENISIKYGFESSVYFRRLFKAYAGKTPKEYRETSHII